ncbi:hypothetical protein BJY24_002511 [Nocardia transvalensis]|uniref:Uncharacterized protein n=1 Tax=Nocardia transvalensis TaxID=37333 RepID=A0A7W9PCL4_9NOCA|nr:hypothetical protein [Nocardia transvalensis]MBB5913644.1 hypothetical protein [Nocardia transvalensis]
MKRLLATTATLASIAACAGIALAPAASAVPPKNWHPCSDDFRDATDPQAWDGGRHQPIVSPWGNTGVFCAWDWIDGVGRVGWIDAFQADPSGRPHAMIQVPMSGDTTLWITNPL